VAYASEHDSYYDPATMAPLDGWSSYFAPVDQVPQSEAELQFDCRANARAYEVGAQYARSMTTLSNQRHDRLELMRKLNIEPRPALTRAANEFWASHMAPFGRNRSVLGVHLRGTDRWPPNNLENLFPKSYLPCILRILAKSRETVLFVATDQLSWLEELRKQLAQSGFSQTPVVARKARRGHGKLNPSQHAAQLKLRGSVARQLGRDAVVDTLLLSYCDLLLRAESAVGEYAVLFRAIRRQDALHGFDLQLANSKFDFNRCRMPSPPTSV